MRHLQSSLALVLNALFVFSLLSVSTAHAAGKKKPGDSPVDPAVESAAEEQTAPAPQQTEENCAGFLQAASQAPMIGFAAFGETHTLDDLGTLVQKNPSLVMDASQIYLSVLKRHPAREIRDPSYRTEVYQEYPIFADGLPEAGGLRIVGQQGALSSFAGWLEGRASGSRSSKMFTFLGPAGTGKTQVLKILDTANAYLAMTNEEYFQWTFEFQNLDEIPALRPLLGKSKELGIPILQYLAANNSPIVLLPPSMQNELIRLGTPAVEKRIGYKPIAFTTPSPQTAAVIKYIVAHEMQKRKISGRAPTEKEYYDMIKPYVKVVRRTYDLNQPAVIVRAQGKSPELSQLLISENLVLSTWYGPASPLSYHYSGQIIRNQGGGLLLDEFQRQDAGLKNIFLDVAQNGAVEYAGAPAMQLNVVPVLADNDESVEAAKEEGSAFAQLDRTKPKPMRSLIEPAYIQKLSFEMNKPSMFAYRALEEGEDQIKPLDLNVVYPNANMNGELPTPDGRYAVYWAPSGDAKTLIAPRALALLSLTVAATRLEVDAGKVRQHLHEIPSAANFSQYFTDPIERLKILIGKTIPDARTAYDLAKWRKIAKEGQSGITSRDQDEWTKEVLNKAAQLGSSATPAIVDRVFIEMLDESEIKLGKEATPAAKARWLQLHARVKAELILPMLTEDIARIVSGDSGRVERMYDEIKSELLELDKDPNAEEFFPEGERTPINKDRLKEIEKIFAQMHGKELGAGLLKNFHVDVTVKDRRYQPLVDAITRFLMVKEFDVSILTELHNYFKGKTVSEHARQLGMHAELNLARNGYDKQSFMQALMFVRDQQAELKNQLNRRPQ